MTATVIVPLDTSEYSEAALPLARELTRRIAGRMLLLSILEMPPDFAIWLRGQEATEEWAAHHVEVERYLSGVAARITDVPVETRAWSGDPAAEIVAAARDAESPVIVMASHARSGLERMVAGSVAIGVVHNAPCPVVVTRRIEEGVDPEPGDLSRLLVALDGSEFAEAALIAAQEVLGDTGLTIHLLQVIETSRWYGSTYATIDYAAIDYYVQSMKEHAARYLDSIAAGLESLGHTVTREVRSGNVAEEIQHAARAHNAGLIVMATHGRTGLGRVVIGSVAEQALHESEIPIMLVRPRTDQR